MNCPTCKRKGKSSELKFIRDETHINKTYWECPICKDRFSAFDLW